MESFLKRILEVKRQEVAQLKRTSTSKAKAERRFALSDFAAAISRPGEIRLIAEIKFASPSAGVIRTSGDPVKIARTYAAGGAAALSVLTDKTFFAGKLEFLAQVKAAVEIPVLRKDFIIDSIQIEESYHEGADALLLIAAILSARELKNLLAETEKRGLSALVEVHDEADLQKALDSGAHIIGINNRNLKTFETNPATTQRLALLVPEDRILVSESGICGAADLRLLPRDRVKAVLVGSALMQHPDLKSTTEGLVAAGRG